MKARIILMLVSVLYVSFAAGQQPTAPGALTAPPNFIQTPTTAGLGIYGSIPVSPYTGLPDIKVDVFSLKNRDLQLHAALRYFGGGVKTEDHPGWVGQNWSLDVGGVITRKINGGVDEVDISNPDAGYDENEFAYLFHFDKLNYDDWYTQERIKSTIFKKTSLAPDEFNFTLPSGVSGSFYLNDKGQWVARTASGAYLTISAQVNTQPIVITSLVNPTKSTNIKRAFYSFTITDQDGIVYTFGNDPSAIEFYRGNRSIPSGAQPNNEDVIANAWYLTRMTSPKGAEIDLTYQRKENQLIQGRSYAGGNMTSTGALNGKYNIVSCGFGQISLSYNYTILTPCYLKEIKSTSFDVRFDIGQTTELRYNYRDDANGYQYFDYDDLVWTDVDNFYAQSQWYQLNTISVYDGNQRLKDKYKFTYNDDPNQRLYLQNFTRLDVSGLDGVDKIYNFSYNNPGSLPAYNSFQADNDGYYNGRVFADDFFQQLRVNLDPNFVQEVITQTSPDSNYMQLGSLTKIGYPTGGYTEFFYGPNYYSSQYQITNSGVDVIPKTGFGGGLRINKIIDHVDAATQYARTYFYSTPENPSVSSGISAGMASHFYNISMGNPALLSGPQFNINPMNTLDYTNGRDIVYSGVREVLSDGSYTDYKFTNSDNPEYKDEPSAGIYSLFWGMVPLDGTYYFFDYLSSYSPLYRSYVSRELERGRILSKKMFNAQGKMVYKVENEYNIDPSRFNEYVKSYEHRATSSGCAEGLFQEDYIMANKIYTYYPFLSKQEESIYTVNGTAIVTTKTFQYKATNHLLNSQSTTDSKGMIYTTTFTYPMDYQINGGASNPISQGIQDLQALNLISPVIEKVTQRSNSDGSNPQPIEAVFTAYKPSSPVPDVVYNVERTSPFTGFSPAVITATTATLDPRYKSVLSYNQYDNNLNLTEQQRTGDMKEVFLWGYNGQYPVARVVGSDYITVKGLVNQSVLDNAGNTDDATIRAELNKIRTALTGTGVLVFTYTYNALLGVSSQTDPAGNTTYYEYDANGRLMHIKDKDGHILKRFEYKYAN